MGQDAFLGGAVFQGDGEGESCSANRKPDMAELLVRVEDFMEERQYLPPVVSIFASCERTIWQRPAEGKECLTKSTGGGTLLI